MLTADCEAETAVASESYLSEQEKALEDAKNRDMQLSEAIADIDLLGIPDVRVVVDGDALVSRQRAFRQPPGLIADGRDMGTVIFPDAALKIFLTASAEARALRRYKQLKEKGESVNLTRLFREIKARDLRDQSRSVAPLRPAEDAKIIDSSRMSIEEVFAKVVSMI